MTKTTNTAVKLFTAVVFGMMCSACSAQNTTQTGYNYPESSLSSTGAWSSGSQTGSYYYDYEAL